METEQQKAAQRRRTVLDRHLRKTKLCGYFQQGACTHGSKCGFAHGKVELHDSPALYKTRICPQVDTCADGNCKYAHAQQELRCTDFCYKTTLCIWHSVGKCRNYTNCRFAHGKEELRVIPGEQQLQEKQPAMAKGNNKEGRKLPKEGTNAVDGDNGAPPKDAKTKTRAARRAEAKTFNKAHNKQEENLAPVQEEPHSLVNQPMFIQPGGAANGYANRFELPASVNHNLLEQSGFLAPLRVPESSSVSNSGSAGRPSAGIQQTPPGLGPSMGNVNAMHQLDYIANDIQKMSLSYGAEAQKATSGAKPEEVANIQKLAQNIRSLSEQLATLQQCIAHQTYPGDSQQFQVQSKGVKVQGHTSRHGSQAHSSAKGSQGKSESTKSGSDFNHSSSNGSSPPSTPGKEAHYHTQKNLSQLEGFSRELQMALGSNMSMFGNIAHRDFMASQQQQRLMGDGNGQ